MNSVVSKSISSASGSSSNPHQSLNNHSPSSNFIKTRHDSSCKDDSNSKSNHQPGICTIIDTKKYLNTNFKQQNLHDENQNWIVAHFLAHHEAIYALEFNQNGRLLCTADSLGQYFNVYQINPNSYKCTRTHVKHLYSLYRGDTSAKVRSISFSNDNRWLAVNTKRGTTHVFPINPCGGAVNARTHSKPFVANRVSKHQRTAGFHDQDDMLNLTSTTAASTINDMYQQQQQQHHQDQNSSASSSQPLFLNNNPKLRHMLEPFVIPAYGQLKQPNVNSQFQSSVLTNPTFVNANPSGCNYSGSASGGGGGGGGSGGLLAAVINPLNESGAISSGLNAFGGLSGTAIAASALSSAALVTENVTNFGMKNFSFLG